MKHKLILLAFALLLAVTAQAQDYIVMPDHQMNSRIVTMDMRNILELRDGSIVANMQLFDTIQGVDCMDYGCMFYKIEYDSVSVAITDSVFIEDHDMNYFLLERNPLDNDNVYAKIVCDYDACRSDLRISFFDDDLNFKPEKEIWVPISDTLIIPLADGYLLDESGDLVFFYKIKSRKEYHVVKTGLDGVDKAHTTIPFDDNPINSSMHIAVLNDSPREYCLWGLKELEEVGVNEQLKTLTLIVMDSMLNIERTIAHNTPPNRYKFQYGWDYLENYRDTSFLILTKCDTMRGYTESDTTWNFWQGQWEAGACISKCGKTDAKNHIAKVYHYLPYPTYTYPIGVKKAYDESIYLSFYTYDNENKCCLKAEKLSNDLATLWESCYCDEHTYTGGTQYFTNIVALENGGMAVGGTNYDHTTGLSQLFFVIFKDNCFSVTENKAEESPYTFYPNPTNDELNLSISPDVEPSLIELYDIQGRMVRSQHSGFETISLHGLPAGTYALRVSMKDGKQYTSAVVKK